MSVTYELWDTKYQYTRKEYGFFDWLSDIGGLLDGVKLIGAALIGITVANGPFVFTSADLVASTSTLSESSGENFKRLESMHSSEEV